MEMHVIVARKVQKLEPAIVILRSISAGVMDHGDARIELLAAMSELHATMSVAKKRLELVEQKLWQFFKLDTPQDKASSPPKRSASSEAEQASHQKRQRMDSEKTSAWNLGPGATTEIPRCEGSSQAW